MTDIDAVALEAAARSLLKERGWNFSGASLIESYNPRASELVRDARSVVTAYLAALASAQPAQAGEYEGLAKWLEAWLFTPDGEVTSYSQRMGMLREAASAIRTLEAGIRVLENVIDEHRKRADAAEARALAAEQRLATCTEALKGVLDRAEREYQELTDSQYGSFEEFPEATRACAALSEASHEQR